MSSQSGKKPNYDSELKNEIKYSIPAFNASINLLIKNSSNMIQRLEKNFDNPSVKYSVLCDKLNENQTMLYSLISTGIEF